MGLGEITGLRAELRPLLTHEGVIRPVGLDGRGSTTLGPSKTRGLEESRCLTVEPSGAVHGVRWIHLLDAAASRRKAPKRLIEPNYSAALMMPSRFKGVPWT
jgi:hypothetical protein